MDEFPVPQIERPGSVGGGVPARYGLPVVLGLAGVVSVWLAGVMRPSVVGTIALVCVWVCAVLLVVGMWVSGRHTTTR